MNNSKLTGSIYTPQIVASFLVDYLARKLKNKHSVTILEPSAGDGIFVNTLLDNKTLSSKIAKIIAIEKYKGELNKIRSETKSYQGLHLDFLEYQKNNKAKYSVCIGNPPYIKKDLLTKKQIASCENIHTSAGLSNKKIKNIWSAFLVRCTQFLEDDGILAFVLPAELLQVKYALEIRAFIVSQFSRIEIFTFNKLLFKNIGQDTILLIGYKKSKEPGQFYTQIKNTNQLINNLFRLSANQALTNANMKWTHHILSSIEIKLLQKLKKQVKTMKDYCLSKPGIVTAANEYFIVDSNREKEYKLKSYTKPIIQKGVFVNGSVVFDKQDIQQLKTDGRPTRLLCIPEDSRKELSIGMNIYLKRGIHEKIHRRYKCLQRGKWYSVPHTEEPPEGFFFKRCHEYPKIIRNDAKALVTDSAYKIKMKENYKLNSLIYSFYNSLTLVFAELDGRYYGDGVLELTPNEFKNLPLPYVQITKRKFNEYRQSFENKGSIDKILEKHDEIILASTFQVNAKTIQKIQSIRKKLVRKRFRKD